MAKDVTNRGGRRVKAGGKPASLADKISSRKSTRVFEPFDFDIDDEFETDSFMDVSDLKGENIPKPSEYLSAEQKDGTHLRTIKLICSANTLNSSGNATLNFQEGEI